MVRWGRRSTQFVHRVVSKEVIEPARPLLWACLLHLTTATTTAGKALTALLPAEESRLRMSLVVAGSFRSCHNQTL